MNKVELLSPAGSIESMKAAVNAGCDAVYMGGSRFGARAYADNPEDENLIRAIDYMHARGKKIYITVNTLIKQHELEALEAYLDFLACNGADAIIVQDMGVMRLAKEKQLPFSIHASTQMTMQTFEGVNTLPDRVTRIVPARELSLAELVRLKQETNRELEVFIHGALCYSYSGQCLFSSTVGGRSGNRGRCAQPCRQMYDNKYLLSMKDLCSIENIPRLIEAGIDSFKIEGRMKSPVYTAGVTDIYRRAIDLYYEKGNKAYSEWNGIHPEYHEDVNKMLLELYNRGGFTKGYFDMRNGADMSENSRPNHFGLLVGNVYKAQGRIAFIRFTETTTAGDVLEIRENGTTVFEFTIGKETEGRPELSINCGKYKPMTNAQVYRTKNSKLTSFIEKNIINREYRLPVKAYMTIKIGEPLKLEINEPQSVKVFGDIAEAAQKQPTGVERIKEQLYKTTDACFYINEAVIVGDENVFIPIASINKLRRQILEELENLVISNIKASITTYTVSDKKNIVQGSNETLLSTKVSNMEQFSAVNSIAEVDNIIIETAEFTNEQIKEMLSVVENSEKRIILALPHICRQDTYDSLAASKDILCDNRIYGYLVRTMEEYELLNSVFSIDSDRIRLDYTLHAINNIAKSYWREHGISHFTVSTELTLDEMSELDIRDSELMIYGRVPLMITAQCQHKNIGKCVKQNPDRHKEYIYLTDRLKHIFPVKNICRYCYNILYNDAYHALQDYQYEINRLSPQAVRFEFADESFESVINVIKAYINGESLKSANPEGRYTNGSYKRIVE